MDSTDQPAEPEFDPDPLKLDLAALPNDPQIDRILTRYIHALGSYVTKGGDRTRVPGAVVMVRSGDEIIHLNSYGYANLETGQKITPHTLFDLGSLSKQFTALAVLALKEYKELDLNDNISKFFSGFPRYADSITVGQLIHHTSALPDYIDIHVAARRAAEDWLEVALEKSDEWYPQMSNRRKKELTNKDVLKWIASQKLLPRKPNTEFEYSNTGYVVLAALVEKVSKMRFSQFLKENLFCYLCMNDTYVFDEASAFANDAPEVVNHARCYNHVKGAGFVPVGYTPLNFINGDGNVHSTILDLARWDLYLQRLDYGSMFAKDEPGGLDDAKSFRNLLWARAEVKSRKRVNYGAGWNLAHQKYQDEVEEDGKLVTKHFESSAEYHRGVWLGWRSYIARATRWEVPEEGQNVDPETWESLGIIVLSNNKQFNACRIAQHISQIYWGKLKKDNIMNRFNCG